MLELLLWIVIWSLIFYVAFEQLRKVFKKVRDFYRPLVMQDVDRLLARDKCRCRFINESGKRCEVETQHLRHIGNVFRHEWVTMCPRHADGKLNKDDVRRILG
ncbi:MAG: hypothetical protein EBV07_00350 [Proteobacteria bacterium]|nr:hypothetical protein [Pseudomonadota bacterium]